MLNFTLKISLILMFTHAFAAPELIDNTVEAQLETAGSVLNGAETEITGEAAVLTEEALAEIATEVDLLEEAIMDETESAVLSDDLDNSFAEGSLVLSKDVMLVLDNSGSMKKNDPNFLVTKAVREFIRQQDENTRVGIVIFDQDVRLPVSLTDASLANRETILNSIEDINYKGLFTDSPAGIERAIYELKNNGRAEAQKSVIFMTDGIVDTGAPERDLEKSKWLREDLAPDAADNEIKIFGIAFTDQADFQLIQSIAQKTEGEYYRALNAEDLQGVFERINEIINKLPEVEPEPLPEPVPAPTPVVIEAPAPVVQAPPPVIIEVPAQTMGQEERIRSMIIIAAAIILTITLLGILILLLRRNRELKAGEVVAQEAYINDLQGKTDKQTHKLGTKPTMLGRVAGKDSEHLDYIVVNESTIGRRHSLVEFKDYSYWIVDQGSINGTYVNNEPVSSEVRLKHGDRIRLHRCEFEFIMPEMEDSGMTVISNTVFAAQPPVVDDSEEATQLRDHGGNTAGELSAEERSAASSVDMDFDLTGAGADADAAGDLSDLYEPDPDEEDTIIRDLPGNDVKTEEPEFSLDNDIADDSEDETIMLDDADAELDEDATLRKEDI